jgi:hypothetical protein
VILLASYVSKLKHLKSGFIVDKTLPFGRVLGL